MGTSNSFGGGSGSNPLVPSWLPSGGDAFPATPGGSGQNPGMPPSDGGGPKTPPRNRSPLPPAGSQDRYTSARTDFSRFTSSGGQGSQARHALGRAMSKYVSTASNGKRTAARRMGSSLVAGSRLLGALENIRATSTTEVLRTLRLEGLIGRPVEEVFLGLMEHVCPPGGTVDEGIARDAFIETVAEVAELGIADLDKLTVDQIQAVLEAFATHSIEARLYNDIGTKVVTLPADPVAAGRIQNDVRDFIRRGVSDALAQARAQLQAIEFTRIPEFINGVYEAAFGIIQQMGDTEANS